MFGLHDNYINSQDQNSEMNQKSIKNNWNGILKSELWANSVPFSEEKQQIQSETTDNLIEEKIKMLIENIEKNIDELLKYIEGNYKWNENVLRKLFLTKIKEDEYKLNYYNNQKLLVFLNAKILFWDYSSLQSWNLQFFKDNETWDFKDSHWNKLLIYADNIISTSILDVSKDWLNITIDRHDKDFFLEYTWSKIIYVTIDDQQYWEFVWDIKSNKYILQNHDDWNKALIIEKWKNYTITLSDKVLNKNYETLLEKNLEKEEIEKLYSIFTEREDKIEEIKNNILLYLTQQIVDNNLSMNNNEYIYYIDKLVQRSFLIYNNFGKLEIIGYDKISSWNPNRNNNKKKYYETPNIIIDRTKSTSDSNTRKISQWDWRSQWTNSKWYWKEWSKIFNLWKYHIDNEWIAYEVYEINKDWLWYIYKNWKKIQAYVNFHFAMHKTSPRWTTKLWWKLSQWCIRNTPFSIDLLDSQRILDWEKWKYIIIWSYNEYKDRQALNK